MEASVKVGEVESNLAREAENGVTNHATEQGSVTAVRFDDADETLYLAGRPTIKKFIRFVRHHGVDRPDEGALVDEWNTANRHIKTLEKEEAGCADNPKITTIEVDSKYQPLLSEFIKDPLVQGGFNNVPSEVAFIELDRLVVYQKHIDLTYVRQLKQRLGKNLSGEELFRTCLPYDHPHPPVKWSRLDDESFVFVSPSNDMRYLGMMPLKPEHIEGLAPPGALVGVVGVAIGFGSNFLNAIYAENRLILNNGSHRAYALRDLGYTHVPCVVQHVSTRDELEMVASSEVRSDPDRFLKNPRPSMLRDYFNPKLHKVVAVRREHRHIKVRFSVSDYNVPAL